MKVENVEIEIQNGLFYASRSDIAKYLDISLSSVSRLILDKTRFLNDKLVCINDLKRMSEFVKYIRIWIELKETVASSAVVESKNLELKNTVQDLTNQIEQQQQDIINLESENDKKQSKLLDVKLFSNKKDTFIKYVKSKKTTQFMMLFIIIATFFITFWEVIHLPKFDNLSTIEFIVYLPILLFSLTMSIAVVWTAFNKSDRKWVDNLTLFVFVGVEVSSSSNFFGLNEVLLNGTILQIIITFFLSVGLPTLSIKIANHQSKSEKNYALKDILKAFNNSAGTDLNLLNKFKSELLK
mgnify:FL=1